MPGVVLFENSHTSMYNISELNAMPDEQLKSVAEGLGLKKIDLSRRDELMFRVLDQQAVAEAAVPARGRRKADSGEEEAADKLPRKRGRKKKETVDDGDKAPAMQVEEAPAAAGDAPKADSAPAENAPAVVEKKTPRTSSKEESGRRAAGRGCQGSCGYRQ